VTGKPRQPDSGREGREGNGTCQGGWGGADVGWAPPAVSVSRAGRVGLAGLAGFGSPWGPTCKIPFRLRVVTPCSSAVFLFDQENTF